MVIVALVLVIACVNVANLLLARASSRRKEFAVRVAIGAASGRIVRQLLTESILLAFAGGALGLLLARWGTNALLKLSGNNDLEASPDLRVFLFTATVCVLTGVLFGLIPALRSRRVAVALTLKSGSQNGPSAHAGWNWGKLLVTGQVAVSLLVLFVAGLLVHSLQNIRNVDLGYNREHLLVVSTDPLAAGYDKARIASFANELAEQIGSLPGVRAVTSSKNGLFSGSESGNSIKVEGYTSKNDPDLQAAFDQVAPNYFHGVGIPMLLGRDIGLQDTGTSPRVAVINETMARFYFGQTNPIGRKFIVEDPESKGPVEIVGVARDARDHKLKGSIDRRFYLPLAQSLGHVPGLNLVVRTVGNPVAVAEAVRKQIKNLDANVPVNNIRSLNELTEKSISDQILIARLSSFFAGLGAAFGGDWAVRNPLILSGGTHPRNRRANGPWRTARQRAENDFAGSWKACAAGSGHRNTVSDVGEPAIFVDAVWAERHRSGFHAVGDRGASGDHAARQLYSGASGDKSGSDDRVAVRIGDTVLRDWRLGGHEKIREELSTDSIKDT